MDPGGAKISAMHSQTISPLLELHPDAEAFIEPSRIIEPRDVPTACVLTWFGDAALRWIGRVGGSVVVENPWEDGQHPLYEVTHRGQRLAVMPMAVGAPMAAALLEEVIAFGCRSFVACGGAGALRRELTLGHLMLVTSAVRDEGTSHHYLTPARTLDADAAALRAWRTVLEASGAPFVEGRTWTTDAPYRETASRIAARTDEGCLMVEMEAAAIAAVAQFRGRSLAQVLYAGDDLSGEIWDRRGWNDRHEVRDRLLQLAADAALALDAEAGYTSAE